MNTDQTSWRFINSYETSRARWEEVAVYCNRNIRIKSEGYLGLLSFQYDEWDVSRSAVLTYLGSIRNHNHPASSQALTPTSSRVIPRHIRLRRSFRGKSGHEFESA